jgi:hypothetical protein
MNLDLQTERLKPNMNLPANRMFDRSALSNERRFPEKWSSKESVSKRFETEGEIAQIRFLGGRRSDSHNIEIRKCDSWHEDIEQNIMPNGLGF